LYFSPSYFSIKNANEQQQQQQAKQNPISKLEKHVFFSITLFSENNYIMQQANI